MDLIIVIYLNAAINPSDLAPEVTNSIQWLRDSVIVSFSPARRMQMQFYTNLARLIHLIWLHNLRATATHPCQPSVTLQIEWMWMRIDTRSIKIDSCHDCDYAYGSRLLSQNPIEYMF